MKWPLLIPTLAYAAGVLIGSLLQVSPWVLLPGSGLLLLAALLFSRGRQWLLTVLLAAAGWTHYAIRSAVLSKDDLRILAGAQPRLAAVRGALAETPYLRVFQQGEVSNWRTLARIEVSAVKLDKSDWQPASGYVAVATPGTLTNLFGGQTVEVAGVLSEPPGPIAEGTFDYRQFLKQQGIYYRLQSESVQDWRILASPAKPPLADRFRNWGRSVLARGLLVEDESLRLEWALTLGWKTALNEQTSEPFVRAATYHIFAVDGLRMAIVFGILFSVLRAANLPRWLCGLPLLPFIWFYVALTGWPASAIRATIMLSVVICGWVLRRPINLLNSLFAAAFIILVWDPRQLFQAGFQLSFIVVLFMILMLPPTIKVWERLTSPDPLLPPAFHRRWPAAIRLPGRYCGDLFLTSLVAWLASIPLVAYYFNIITPVSTPANVLAVPLCALVLMSNLGSMLLAPLFGPAAELFNHAGWFLMECIRISSQWFSDWPLAWAYVPKPNLYTSVLYYGLLLAISTGWLFEKRLRVLRLGLAGMGVGIWAALLLPGLFYTKITVLPAYGGAVTWCDGPGSKNDVLVDCGNTNAVTLVTKPFLQAQGVNRIPTLVLSHGDLHHVGGTRILTGLFPVSRVCTSPMRFRSTAYKRLIQDFAADPRFSKIGRGDKLGIWEVLHPLSNDRFSRADDGTLVLRATVQGVRVTLLNDLGRAGQELLLERVADLQTDVLVVGLPSVGEAVADSLLDAMRPRLILVADSEFPASERAREKLRERLARRKGSAVVYTRFSGAATLLFQKGEWEIRTVSGPSFNARNWESACFKRQPPPTEVFEDDSAASDASATEVK